MGALHGKVEGRDAICSPMGLVDLDEIAGFAGFGEAMKLVGWVLVRDDDSLIFQELPGFQRASMFAQAGNDKR